MAVARLKFLDADEEQFVHEQTIKCLEEIGVKIRSEPVLSLLESQGASVDRTKQIARISEDMVNEALMRAPKEIRLCARDPKKDISVPVESYPHISNNGLSVYMTDLETGQKRDTTRSDLASFARLADHLDAVSHFWPQVTAMDVMEASHAIHELWTSFQNCTKNVQGDAVSVDEARMQIRLGELVAGGEQELRRRPVFSVTCCSIAPLSFERGAVEAQVELARAGIPIVSMSMSLSGMSSPVTIAGTVINANAENLASLVISQCAQPGAPVIYSSESAPIDMVTGGIDYVSAEVPLISAACAQMARRYGRPSSIGQWGVNGPTPGITYSFTEMASIGLVTMVNTDMISGMGGLEAAKGASLEQLVIDAYMWENFRGFLRKVRIDDERAALDVMREVGHGNTFLTHPHTAKNFKKELFFRDRKKLAWEATLSDRMVAEAREIVRSVLREHEVEPLDPDVLSQGNVLVKEYEMQLAR